MRQGGDVTDTELTLHQAADSLGVHYMTAYRYVRLGLLCADKVGGTWRVAQTDLDSFRAASVSDPTDAGVVIHGRRRAPWAERLEARLVAGDSRGAWGVIEAALASGADLEEIYLDVMSPALTSIGDRWATGELCVTIEHRASGIASRIVARLGPRFARRGRTRGSIIMGAPEGEQHSLPVAMLSDLLRQRGWDVSDLGADVPASALGRFVALADDDLVAVGLSVSTERCLPSLVGAIEAVRSGSPLVWVAAGGSAIDGLDHARSLGADGFAEDGRAFACLLESMHPHG
jgi:MerR family transcriptional regulator, light-induced transcriptional regulator